MSEAWIPFWTALSGSVFSLITLFVTLLVRKRIGRVHKEINGRMGELLAVTKEAATAKGKEVGKAEEKSEQNERDKEKS